MTKLIGKQGLLLRPRGNVYKSCVGPIFLYCSETWELTMANGVRLCSASWMLRMISGVKLANTVSSVELYQSWYGHSC